MNRVTIGGRKTIRAAHCACGVVVKVPSAEPVRAAHRCNDRIGRSAVHRWRPRTQLTGARIVDTFAPLATTPGRCTMRYAFTLATLILMLMQAGVAGAQQSPPYE